MAQHARQLQLTRARWYPPMARHVRHFKLREPSWHQSMARHVRPLQIARAQLALASGAKCATTSTAGPSWHQSTALHELQLQTVRDHLVSANGATCATTSKCKSPAGIGQLCDMCDDCKLRESSWHRPMAQHVRQLRTARAKLVSATGATRAITSSCKSPAGTRQRRDTCDNFNYKGPTASSHWKEVKLASAVRAYPFRNSPAGTAKQNQNSTAWLASATKTRTPRAPSRQHASEDCTQGSHPRIAQGSLPRAIPEGLSQRLLPRVTPKDFPNERYTLPVSQCCHVMTISIPDVPQSSQSAKVLRSSQSTKVPPRIGVGV
jgi:hypothetical protein